MRDRRRHRTGWTMLWTRGRWRTRTPGRSPRCRAHTTTLGSTALGRPAIRRTTRTRIRTAYCRGTGPSSLWCTGMERSRRCKHFKPFGFIKTGDFGSTGLQLDLSRECKAAIKGMEPDSAAAKAGIQPADEIVEGEGQPLTASTGEEAAERLVGRAGDQFQPTVRQGQTDKTVELQLQIRHRFSFGQCQENLNRRDRREALPMPSFAKIANDDVAWILTSEWRAPRSEE